MEDLTDGGIRISMSVGVGPELVSWILSFGPDVRVEGPDELKLRIRRLHAEAARNADNDSWGRR